MNRKALIGVIAGATACLTLAGASIPAGAQSADPGNAAPNSASATLAQAGTAFTFQGQIKKDGGAFSGACSFRFTLFDAASGAGQVGTLPPVDVTVTNGLFTVPLDLGNQFTGQARWLETAVKCAGDADFIPQSPRLNMTSSPYAIGVVPGAVVQGATTNSMKAVFWAINTPEVIGAAVRGDSPGAYGVQGSGTVGVEGTGQTVGVRGYSDVGVGVVGDSTSGQGVIGRSHSSKAGVQGKNDSSGPGVRGYSSGNAGVYGYSDNAFGVYGEAINNYAIKGMSLNSVGVYGESTNSAGLYGLSSKWHGVIGRTTDPTKYAVLADGKVAITGGTDIAERFSSANGQTIEPGTVVVVDEANPGQIISSGAAYARTVVAIAGRVYVKTTAANGAIKPGDLLTTSDLPGLAMKATDRDMAFGAVIGKALTGLDSGAGLVLVLVNLQ